MAPLYAGVNRRLDLSYFGKHRRLDLPYFGKHINASEEDTMADDLEDKGAGGHRAGPPIKARSSSTTTRITEAPELNRVYVVHHHQSWGSPEWIPALSRACARVNDE